MDKLIINICTGVHCSVMGGADLQLLADFLPPEQLRKIEVRTVSCMEYCKTNGSGNAPYVQVDNVVVHDATLNKVVEAVKDYFEKHKPAY